MAIAVAEQNLLIGGEWTGAKSGKECEQTNPYTEETVGRAAAAGPEDVDAAVEAAQGAFEAWGFGPPAARREILTKAADLMQERAEQIAGIVTEETGGTFGWGMFNVQLASGMMREAGAQAYSVVGEVIPSDIPGATALARRQPAGVVVGIAPWNAPVILGTRAIATPLAFGNTVIMKGSELCPRTHAQIVQCVQDAGAPEGVINYLTNDPADASEVVEALIAHPKTRRVNFTGSTRVGKIIAETCGRHLTRCLLELGGKAPMIVMADADLNEAVNAANFGAFMHSGQICMATERIIVDSKIAGEFTDGLVAKASAMTVGDPTNPETMIGPLINKASLEHVSELVEDARAKGAEVKTGGEAEGTCYKPTVLTDVTPEMRIYSEESFGPVVPILEYTDVEDAVRTANDTR
jgi:acyl-CoA reductase-like NAD-dependent aldehyde dehydrogenase